MICAVMHAQMYAHNTCEIVMSEAALLSHECMTLPPLRVQLTPCILCTYT